MEQEYYDFEQWWADVFEIVSVSLGDSVVQPLDWIELYSRGCSTQEAAEIVLESVGCGEDDYCHHCAGSGEGMYDGAACSHCKGTGLATCGREEYEDDVPDALDCHQYYDGSK